MWGCDDIWWTYFGNMMGMGVWWLYAELWGYDGDIADCHCYMISRIWAAIWIYSWEYETNKFLKIYWEIRWMQTQPCESNTVAGMGQIVNVPVRARWFCRIWSHPELRFFSAAVLFFFRGEDEPVQSLARTMHQQAPSTQSSTQLSTPTPEAATCYLAEIYTLW